jgi:hypothetical protein
MKGNTEGVCLLNMVDETATDKLDEEEDEYGDTDSVMRVR